MRRRTENMYRLKPGIKAGMVGLLILLVGFFAGFAAVNAMEETQRTEYLRVVQIAANTMAAGSIGEEAVISAIIQNALVYGMMLLGASCWVLTPFAVIFYSLLLFPFGCVLALAFSLGGAALLCGILCIALPALVYGALYTTTWSKMAMAAKKSLKGERIGKDVRSMALMSIWLVPCCFFHAVAAPGLFSVAANLFW